MSKARNTAHAGIGIITIINILLVLCLAVFSTLTLSSARSDAALSKINAEAAGAYYRADAAAAKLAALDDANLQAALYNEFENRLSRLGELPVANREEIGNMYGGWEAVE